VSADLRPVRLGLEDPDHGDHGRLRPAVDQRGIGARSSSFGARAVALEGDYGHAGALRGSLRLTLLDEKWRARVYDPPPCKGVRLARALARLRGGAVIPGDGMINFAAVGRGLVAG